jgi:hypothetical protein
LHNDLQILKEKEGADFILLNFSFKVRFSIPISPSLTQASLSALSPLRSLHPLPDLSLPFSLRIIFPLTHHSSGLCLQSSPEGEWLGEGKRATPEAEGEEGT